MNENELLHTLLLEIKLLALTIRQSNTSRQSIRNSQYFIEYLIFTKILDQKRFTKSHITAVGRQRELASNYVREVSVGGPVT